jgi:hypothetical protein
VSPLGRVTAQAALNRAAGSERGSIKVSDGRTTAASQRNTEAEGTHDGF